MQIQKACATCKKEIFVRPARVKEKNFCSKSCGGRSRSKMVLVNCQQCGAEIKKHRYLIGKFRNRFFCDSACLGQFQTGDGSPRWREISKKCKGCGRQIDHYLAVKTEVTFCSKECRLTNFKGVNSPNWKGGVSFTFYPQEFTKALKKIIKERDGWQCQNCGVAQEELESKNKKLLNVHHIDNDRKNNDQTNLIALCTMCNVTAKKNRDEWTFFYRKKLEERGFIRP